ncbi:hypothetical protein [Nocardia asteroides]|nr:hypothetical protein [Nocardia asteroides]UGT62525.1 hypothetical protein LTT61_04025 [Nocardia asteroides]
MSERDPFDLSRRSAPVTGAAGGIAAAARVAALGTAGIAVPAQEGTS